MLHLKGIPAIMEDKEVRDRFLEEITDVQNYYIEVLNIFCISDIVKSLLDIFCSC